MSAWVDEIGIKLLDFDLFNLCPHIFAYKEKYAKNTREPVICVLPTGISFSDPRSTSISDIHELRVLLDIACSCRDPLLTRDLVQCTYA